jgi:diguanylate cyclase (GGDEF)-like protein
MPMSLKIPLHTAMRAFAIMALGLLLSISCAHADNQKKILVLHAYHQGLDWSDNITSGINTVFRLLGKKVEIFYEYLDTLRNPDTESFEALAALSKAKYRGIRFHVIIAAGRAAVQFLERYATDLYPGVPVVFCDVRTYDPGHFSGRQVTGILGQIDYQSTIALMLKLHPDCRRITIILDRSGAANDMRKDLEPVLSSIEGRIESVIFQDYKLSEVPDRLRLLGPNELIYLLSFNQDKEGRPISNTEGMRLLARWSPVPIYSSWGYHLGKGIVGGMITSGTIQGEQAAQLALRILAGESAADIPVITRSPNLYMFDYKLIQRLEIDPDNLPPGSVMINRPAGIWIQHTNLLLIVTAVTLLIALILLGCYLMQRRHQNYLNRANDDLERRSRQNSAELQVIQYKFKKQSIIDPFTGLGNKRYTYQRMVEESKKALRYQYDLAVLILDIDRLKQVNQMHGHALGDKILRDVGLAIQHSIREIDLPGRYGGGEFLVVLPNTDLNGAIRAAERIRRNIGAVQWQNGQVRVTLSGGLAELKDLTPAEMVKLAEARLQLAKSRGRDRIVHTGGHQVTEEPEKKKT